MCFLAWTPYSSHTMAYVFSAADDCMERFFFIALAMASSTSLWLRSSERSLVSDTEL